MPASGAKAVGDGTEWKRIRYVEGKDGMGKGRLACVLIRYRGGGPAVLSVSDSVVS